MTLMLRSLFAIVLFAAPCLSALEVVGGGDKRASRSCQTIQLYSDLVVYKDPSLFLPMLAILRSDPQYGWKALMRETPELTTLSGRVQLSLLAEPREFSNFGRIAALYEAADPRLRSRGISRTKRVMIVPVQICGATDPYAESIGFVLVEDLKAAKVPATSGLPPSVRTR